MCQPFNSQLIAGLDYETPFFLFSKNKLIGSLRDFNECFPGAAIHYAMKANSEPGVLQTLFAAGSSFEVASRYELDLLKAIGVPAAKIIYGTSVKPISHIKALYKYGADRFAFDSLPELEKIAIAAPGSRVYVRVTVDDAGSVFRFSEKFGADKEAAVPLLHSARKLGLRPYGLSFHVGSQATNPRAWANALKSIAPLLDELQRIGIRVEVINLGGGYPCAYGSIEAPATLWTIGQHTLEEYRRLPYRPQLILEPGRGLVADAAVLVASVIGRVERRSATWLFLDAGVYNALYEALPFQGSTTYQITSLGCPRGSGQALYALAGPTGDSPDVITREALLPRDIGAGDRLMFHAVGAYSLAVASRFNGFPKPAMHCLEPTPQREQVLS
jgi:ornithine decarboxylase